MKTLYQRFSTGAEKLRDLPSLLFRLILAYGFYEPAMNKINNLNGVAEWFAGMNYPAPMVSAILAMITEAAGVILLTLGLGTRLIAVPMMFVMVVAILTVHLPNGFAAGDNGFEIPLYYFLMLFALLVNGSGRISIDYLAFRKR